jgi:hypothetical protein
MRNGSWQWESDGSSPQYTNWHETEPNGRGSETCVEMYAGELAAFWNDRRCTARAKYICEKERGVCMVFIIYFPFKFGNKVVVAGRLTSFMLLHFQIKVNALTIGFCTAIIVINLISPYLSLRAGVLQNKLVNQWAIFPLWSTFKMKKKMLS